MACPFLLVLASASRDSSPMNAAWIPLMAAPGRWTCCAAGRVIWRRLLLYSKSSCPGPLLPSGPDSFQGLRVLPTAVPRGEPVERDRSHHLRKRTPLQLGNMFQLAPVARLKPDHYPLIFELSFSHLRLRELLIAECCPWLPGAATHTRLARATTPSTFSQHIEI